MSDTSTDGMERSLARDFGHAQTGYAVEFNLDGVCACRTLTVETEEVARVFKELLETKEETSSVRVVMDA